MSVLKFISVVAIVFTISVFAGAQSAQSEGGVTVKHVPITKTPSESGKKMFDSYCAVCHGKAGKGDGPAAPAMKTPPSDLTGLTQKNSGKYPSGAFGRRHSWSGGDGCPRKQGYARVGAAVLEHQPRTRGTGAAEDYESGVVYRDFAGQVRISWQWSTPSTTKDTKFHEETCGASCLGDWRVWPNLSF